MTEKIKGTCEFDEVTQHIRNEILWMAMMAQVLCGPTLYCWKCDHCPTQERLETTGASIQRCSQCSRIMTYTGTNFATATNPTDEEVGFSLVDATTETEDNPTIPKCNCPMDGLGQPLIDGKCSHCGGS